MWINWEHVPEQDCSLNVWDLESHHQSGKLIGGILPVFLSYYEPR